MISRGISSTSLCRSALKPCRQRGALVARMSSTAGLGRLCDEAEALWLAAKATRIAVLGCKTEKQAEQPAYRVPLYLQQSGASVLPVLTFYPDVVEVLGQPVYRRVQDVPGPQLDIVDVFRKPSDLLPHLPDILACSPKPKCVWLQSGIRNPEFEQALIEAGCLVVADRCLMVDRRVALAQGDSLPEPPAFKAATSHL